MATQGKHIVTACAVHLTAVQRGRGGGREREKLEKKPSDGGEEEPRSGQDFLTNISKNTRIWQPRFNRTVLLNDLDYYIQGSDLDSVSPAWHNWLSHVSQCKY